MAQDIDAALSSLYELQNSYEFSIIKLSEQLTIESDPNPSNRTSDVSNDSIQTSITPASLEADLAHYKDLFTKLRFSYLEQITKEKFLRAIIGDSPLIVEHEQNVALESQLVGSKASLKAQKADVADMIMELESQGRSLSRRYESVQDQLLQARELPISIRELQETIDSLRKDNHMDPGSSQSLSLPATLSLLAEEEATLKDIDRKLAALESTFTRKNKELEHLETELKPLEVQRQASQKAAREAQRRKAGVEGDRDDLEEKGRWWKGVSEGLKVMLELEA